MIPFSYNMVDMGGIDLAEANHTVVPGIYEKIHEAINLCGDLILYNWKFADIVIAPSAYTVLHQTGSILINGLIQVTELDEVTVLGIEPPPPPIEPVEPLVATENGIYEAEPPTSGFNPVTVNVVGSEDYIFDCGLVEGYTPINIFNGSQSSDISYNSDGTAHVAGVMNNRRFLGFAVDLTDISSVEFLCNFRNSNNTIGVIASQTIEDIMNNRSGPITIYPAYAATPPIFRVCKMALDTSSLSGQYYVGILGYEESWSSDLAQIRTNRASD